MIVDLLKESYRDEWKRRDQIASELNIPIGILTLMGSINVYYMRSFTLRLEPTLFVFAPLITAATTFFLLAVYYVARSYHGYAYYQIPTAGALKSHHDALLAYHRRQGTPSKNADDDFSEYLAGRFAEAADANSRSNGSKAAFLHRARRSLIYASVLTGLASIPWVVNCNSHWSPPKVELTYPIVVHCEGDNHAN